MNARSHPSMLIAISSVLFVGALLAASAAAEGAAPATATAAAPAANDRDAIAVSGVLSRDKDCQRLRTSLGETYGLIGRLSETAPGAHIRVTGRRRGQSACGSGPSILVESVRPDDEKRLREKHLQVTGTITAAGVECPALRSDTGRIYTLAGNLKGWKAGDRATVTGILAQGSTCQQGIAITVEDIRRP